MRTTAVRLLRAAAIIVGGTEALANRLGIRRTLLDNFMAGSRHVPDLVLFGAIDIILAAREADVAQAMGEASEDGGTSGTS